MMTGEGKLSEMQSRVVKFTGARFLHKCNVQMVTTEEYFGIVIIRQPCGFCNGN